jgi:hypothetical protein
MHPIRGGPFAALTHFTRGRCQVLENVHDQAPEANGLPDFNNSKGSNGIKG